MDKNSILTNVKISQTELVEHQVQILVAVSLFEILTGLICRSYLNDKKLRNCQDSPYTDTEYQIYSAK